MLTIVQPFSKDEIQGTQQQDPVTGNMFDYSMRNKRPVTHTHTERWQSQGWSQKLGKRRVISTDGTMHRKNPTKWQPVLSEEHCTLILMSCINEMGHLGTERQLKLIRVCFFWLKNTKTYKQFFSQMCKCLKNRKQTGLCTRNMNCNHSSWFHCTSCIMNVFVVMRRHLWQWTITHT